MVYPDARQTKAVCPLKKLGDAPRWKLGHDPGSSETGNNPTGRLEMIDRKEKRFQLFAAFLSVFVHHLNQMSSEGWALLVEGRRDENALRELGYEGVLATVASLTRGVGAALHGSKKVIILTDLDREGGVLAARFVKKLSHEGFKVSLVERRRLKAASHGTFLHVENLSRFAGVAELKPSEMTGR